MKVAILDSGIDLRKLYTGERHGYEAVWVDVEALTFLHIASCDLVIIPAGSDGTLLHSKADCLREFLLRGGWIFCFDGIIDGLFDDLKWVHTKTDYKSQQFHLPASAYSFLLDNVPLSGLARKDGVRGWWCEGELCGSKQIPLIVDDRDRVVASLVPSQRGSGVLIATAAARLPIFSSDPSLASNILFSNCLEFCRRSTPKPSASQRNIFLHSGNWAHRSFLASDDFREQFTGVHWSCLDAAVLSGVSSVWIPWESNTRALCAKWPLIEEAVNNGTVLVIEDLRDNWLPGVQWQSRPVDSNWWRENRHLDLIASPAVSSVFPNTSPRSFFWHYHGVFNGPADGVPLLTTTDGSRVLAVCGPSQGRRGRILVSTLDATFEFGVGKIRETAQYINTVLDYIGNVHQATGKA